MLKILTSIVFLFISCGVFANDTYVYNNTNMYKSFIISEEYHMVQLEDNKIYLIKKVNHKGCDKLLNDSKPAFAWKIPARKYVSPVYDADRGIEPKLLEKLNYVLLTDQPYKKSDNISQIIEQKRAEGEFYCEAIAMNY